MEKITLPLSPPLMVEFFKDKTTEYFIDYDASLNNLQSARFLLMYIANLGLTCNVDKITDEFVAEYMMLREFATINNVKVAHANILYYGKYESLFYQDDGEDDWIKMFDEQRIENFIRLYPDIVLVQKAFLNSMPLYILSRQGIDAENPNTEQIRNAFKGKVTDQLFEQIGFPLLMLFSQKDFLMMYLRENVPLIDQIYFTRYFEEYMFGGKSLFAYFASPKNAYMGLVQLLTNINQGDEQAKTTLVDLTTKMTRFLEEAANGNTCSEQ